MDQFFRLNSIGIETGVITGNKSMNPVFSSWIHGANDGKVSVENAKIEGMKDFLVIQDSHSFIMRNTEVIRQIVHFIEYGEFESKE